MQTAGRSKVAGKRANAMGRRTAGSFFAAAANGSVRQDAGGSREAVDCRSRRKRELNRRSQATALGFSGVQSLEKKSSGGNGFKRPDLCMSLGKMYQPPSRFRMIDIKPPSHL